MKWYAVSHPGLEPVVARELADLGVEGSIFPGGVRFDATPQEGAALVPRLRTPSRLLLELLHGPARSVDELTALVKRVLWKTWLLPNAVVDVRATAKGSRLHFADSVEKKVGWLVREGLKGPRVVDRTPRATVTQRLSVRIENDRATLSLDAGGGELLHFRGWRTEQGAAPLRENLAAAMLVAAGWTGDEALVDPFCGAGTIPIEAALLASGRSPYVRRTFACQEWPSVHVNLGAIKPEPLRVPIIGCDRDGRAVDVAEANARRAQVVVGFRHCDVSEVEPPAPTGLVITNPPYGKRLEAEDGKAWSAFGRVLRGRFSGWRAMFLCPDPGLAGRAHPKAQRLVSFSNGGLRVGVYAVEVI